MPFRKMSILFSFVLFAALCMSPAFADAASREYPYIYKSPRAMGMGGAYTAVGGSTDTLFYNPAGLNNIPRDKGWDFSLVKVSGEAGDNSVDFFDDLTEALDTEDMNNDGSSDDEQQRAVNDVLAKYRGENLHIRVANFTGMGKSWERKAFGIGGIVSGRMDAIAHQGFSADGVLELNSDVTAGGISGLSYAITNNLYMGFTVKTLSRESVIHNFTARELVDHQDDLDDFITDQLKVSGSAVGYDAGFIWKFAQDSWFRPSLGVSALNIGDLDFKEAGMIPMSINAGIALKPRITWFRSLILAADYVDITENFTQDKDAAKRIRYGAELQLFDKLPIEMTVRAGMYQGSATFGADLRLLFITASYAMYTEEIGAYAGQDEDKRQLLTLTVGW